MSVVCVDVEVTVYSGTWLELDGISKIVGVCVGGCEAVIASKKLVSGGATGGNDIGTGVKEGAICKQE